MKQSPLGSWYWFMNRLYQLREPSDRMGTGAGALHLNFISSYPLLLRINSRFSIPHPAVLTTDETRAASVVNNWTFRGLTGGVRVRRSIQSQ